MAASPPMSPTERAVLNPVEKWRRFGRIPWKLTVHVLLVVATTWMVYMWSSNDALHIRHSYAYFHRALLGIAGTTPSERHVEISTAEDLKKQIDSAVEGFWGIGGSRFANYSLCHGPLVVEASFHDPEKSSIAVELWEATWKRNMEYEKLTTEITPDVSSLVVKGTVHDRFEGAHFRQCLRWSLDTVFDFGGSGLFVGGIDYSVAECSKDGDTNYVAPLLVVLLALISIMLCIKALLVTDRLVTGWLMFNFFGNTVQIIAAIACMRLGRRTDVAYRFFLIGIAAGTAWISVIRYLRYFPSYYLLIRTLSRAVPRCTRFVTGVSPILIGYALLGNCLFHQSVMFTSIGASIATLFSLLNGDIIRDTFTDICQLRPVIGEIYLYSFLCLFIYVVLHTFISIVEEAYFTAKSHREPPSELFLREETDEAELTFPSQPTTASSTGVASYVLNNVKRDLEMLQSLGQLDPRAKDEIMIVLAHR